jgi:hypothetical protein
MSGKRSPQWAVTALVLAGAACVSLRATSRYDALVGRGDSIWRLTYAVDFHAQKAGSRLRMAFPFDTQHSRVFRQEFVHPALEVDRFRTNRAETREVVAVAPRRGDFHAEARFDLHISPRASWRSGETGPALSPKTVASYLRDEPSIQVSSPMVAGALERLKSGATTRMAMVDRLFEFCLMEIEPAGDEGPADAAGALEHGAASPLGRARAMVALCRAAKVPARLVTGFQIEESDPAVPHVWVEVLANGHWEPYDPENGFARQLPANVLPVRRDGVSIVRGSGVTGLESSFTISRLPPPPGVSSQHRFADVFDLTRLPLEMHEVVSVILLMPLGALLTAIFRNVIGVRTFGTFTPTLLALSFVYADWRSGLLMFVALLGIGLASRTLLERLKLLLIPRLSIVLTLVVLGTVFGLSLMEYLDLTPSAQAVLLPMVILTMTIERFYVAAEEDGPRFAVQLLAATVGLAFLCYLVLRWEDVGRLLLVYPEIHFFTIAALILLGRYAGYRLVELWRFRDFLDVE